MASNINLDSIMRKVSAYSKTENGKAKMRDVIQQYRTKGVGKTAAGDKVITESDMWMAASKMIDVLRSTAQSCDLPPSVLRHFDSLECSQVYEMPDGTSVIYIYFEDDLHRDSLENDLGYEGIDNIIALFNNGYHAHNYVYGWWNGHRPTGEAVSRGSTGTEDFAWVRSKKEREGLQFIQQAVRDFNGNYGADYNETAVAGDDYE